MTHEWCWWQNLVIIFCNLWNYFWCEIIFDVLVLILFPKNLWTAFFQIRILFFSGRSFRTHLYWVASYLLVWQNNCFINPKSASSELLNAIWTNSERNIGDFCPIFEKKIEFEISELEEKYIGVPSMIRRLTLFSGRHWEDLVRLNFPNWQK